MKQIKKDDLFRNIDEFLKARGIELRDSAPLSKRLKQGCDLLTDTINGAHKTLETAKNQMDSRLERMRQKIHEKTAPKGKTKKKSRKKNAAATKVKATKKTTKTKKAAPKKKASRK